jgi:hypothetical protein
MSIEIDDLLPVLRIGQEKRHSCSMNVPRKVGTFSVLPRVSEYSKSAPLNGLKF